MSYQKFGQLYLQISKENFSFCSQLSLGIQVRKEHQLDSALANDLVSDCIFYLVAPMIVYLLSDSLRSYVFRSLLSCIKSTKKYEQTMEVFRQFVLENQTNLMLVLKRQCQTE